MSLHHGRSCRGTYGSTLVCLSWWSALQQDNAQHTACRSEQSHLPEIKDTTRSEVLWKMPDDKYWHKQDDRKSNRSRDSTSRRLVFVVLLCMQPAEFRQRVIIHVKWQAADVKDGGNGTSTSLALSYCLGSGLHFVLQRCYCAIFTAQGLGLSINNSSCFLPLCFLLLSLPLFSFCRSVALSEVSQSSSSPFHHAVTLSVLCCNFVLHPVILSYVPGAFLSPMQVETVEHLYILGPPAPLWDVFTGFIFCSCF